MISDSDSDGEFDGCGQGSPTTFSSNLHRYSSSSVEALSQRPPIGRQSHQSLWSHSSSASDPGGDLEEEGSDTEHPKSSGEQQSFYRTTGGQHLRTRPIVTSQGDSDDDLQLPEDGKKPAFFSTENKAIPLCS